MSASHQFLNRLPKLGFGEVLLYNEDWQTYWNISLTK